MVSISKHSNYLFPPQPRRRIALSATKYKHLLESAIVSGDPDASIRDFEKRFSFFVPGTEVCATSSGSQAFDLLIRALDLQPGDGMIVPAYTDESVLGVLEKNGIDPQFADILPGCHTVDPNAAEKAITNRTRAIMITHLFGNPADVDRLKALADRHNLLIFEDCAHAIGSIASREPVGTIGDGALFSFSSTKPFAVFGGGMAVSRHGEIVQSIREEMISKPPGNLGKLLKEMALTIGLDAATNPLVFGSSLFWGLHFMQLTNIEAITAYKTLAPSSYSFADHQFTAFQARFAERILADLEQEISERQARGNLAIEALGSDRIVHSSRPNDTNTFYFLLVKTPCRHKVAHYLLKRGIDTGHTVMRHCASLSGKNAAFPQTERAIAETIQVPHSTRMSRQTYGDILEITSSALQHCEGSVWV